MKPTHLTTSSHALLANLAAGGVDRVFLVPGESYLGILDALNDFPQIDLVTCRHEAGAGFMALADARLSRRPGVAMVSRGPGASNAAIAVHTAQQDATPFILVVGQVPKASLRRGAFQEIDYQQMFAGIAKWVVEPTEPQQLPEAAFKAVRIATSGTPGPVIIVLPEDIQQQAVASTWWTAPPHAETIPTDAALAQLRESLAQAQRPLIVAGGAFDRPGGREALRAFAQAWHIPVAVSFRRHDLFDHADPLYVGDLGLVNPSWQLDAFHESDLLLALGTRFGDITSQGYTFPAMPRPTQKVVHCHVDGQWIGQHFTADIGLACDPVRLAELALPAQPQPIDTPRRDWASRLRELHRRIAAWPEPAHRADGLDFSDVVQVLSRLAPQRLLLTLDAGTFGAPIYRHFALALPQRLLAPISGAMGYGVPAAVAAQLRDPQARVVCAVGDGGFMMTGNEMISAVQRRLPILILLSNNGGYGSIRVHQDREYPGRHAGTSLVNPDFVRIAQAFGMPAERVDASEQIEPALRRGLAAGDGPYLIEFRTLLSPRAQASTTPTLSD